MKTFLTRHWFTVVLTLLGIAAGFVHWRYIGCTSGTCPITAHWHTSSAYGAVIGYLSGSLINDFHSRQKK